MATENTLSWSAHAAFATLDECLAFVRSNHPQRLIWGTAKDIETGRHFECRMPAYLFRGEVGWLDECLSRRERVRRGHFSGVTEEALQPVGKDVDRTFQKRLAIQPMLSAGLMQHYGWPTEFIDASASLCTAAFFARCGASGSGRGALAVIDIETLRENGVIVDLSEHPLANRPKWQRAYGVWHSEHRDLKQQQAISDMGLSWYVFRNDPQHDARVTKGEALLSVLDDDTAGFLRLLIDGAIERHGKRPDSAAKYLAERIVHCPVAMQKRTDGQLRPVALSESRISMDDQEEIDTSYKLWSTEYPDVVKRPTRTTREHRSDEDAVGR